MQQHPVLGQVAFGYSPVIGRQRQVVATRLTVFPARPDAAPDAGPLLHALHDVWPPQDEQALQLSLRDVGSGAPPARSGAPVRAAPASASSSAALKLPPVSLNVADENLLRTVIRALPAPHFMLEIPAFMAVEAELSDNLLNLHAAGSVLLLKGRPVKPLSKEILACFSHTVVDADEERRTSPAATPGLRHVTTIQSGVRSAAAAGQAFERGAVAVLGWPLDDPLPKATGRSTVPPDVQVVLELINGVEREEPVGRLEGLLKRDPTLAFRLLRYLNSPAFGMSVEINSFGHALMMLGYQRLKRWLALLLASSSKGNNAKPLMHAAVRRGLLMEQLAFGQDDPEVRSEMFICGVFSLLDRLLNQPFADLLMGIPVAEKVQQALLNCEGPYGPFLNLVRAIEQEAVFDIREGADALMLEMKEVNHAVLRALMAANQLDG